MEKLPSNSQITAGVKHFALTCGAVTERSSTKWKNSSISMSKLYCTLVPFHHWYLLLSLYI